MTKKQKLELTWVGKENRPRLEPRVLVEVPELSHHAKARVSETDIFDNILIQGDNLLALKALEAEFAGRVKCVYIDPPYNTGSAFKHYDDGLEHSIWLGLMRDRLEILSRLLSDDGHLFCQADDNEAHYLKIVLDEIFGRRNFVTNFIWRKVDSPNDNKVSVTPDHEFIFCYAKNVDQSKLNPKSDPNLANAYGQISEGGRRFRDRLIKKNGASSLRSDRPSMFYPIMGPDGLPVYPIHDDGREARWSLGKESVDKLIEQDLVVWKRRFVFDSERWVPYTREWAPASPTRPHPTIWTDLHSMRQAKAHQKELYGADGVFSTPKPENLIERILHIATSPGDLVLDSFAGSGTTGAVAQKMGRRWIMVELGDHAHTHVVPRLEKVIDGEDSGGITETAGWTGGGGYRYFRLATSLMEKDRWGREVISKAFNAAMLAEALCKLEGFTYTPNPEVWWQHGRSTDSDFLYVTTQTLGPRELSTLSEEVGDERTLLVLCSAWSGDANLFRNLTLRKIPNHVRDKCEWGKDDYSLNVANLPMAESSPKTTNPDASNEPPIRRGRPPKGKAPQPGLFDAEDINQPEVEA